MIFLPNFDSVNRKGEFAGGNFNDVILDSEKGLAYAYSRYFLKLKSEERKNK